MSLNGIHDTFIARPVSLRDRQWGEGGHARLGQLGPPLFSRRQCLRLLQKRPERRRLVSPMVAIGGDIGEPVLQLRGPLGDDGGGFIGLRTRFGWLRTGLQPGLWPLRWGERHLGGTAAAACA